MITRPEHRSHLSQLALATVPDPENRDPHDFYATPAGATEALLRHEKFRPLLWEPACGDGAISKVLEFNGYEVFSSDLIDRGYGETRDFFDFDCGLTLPFGIVTNPPFKCVERFIWHALGLGAETVAMFLRLQFLESIRRKAFFERSPFAKLLVFSDRVPVWRGSADAGREGGRMMPFAWFIWHKDHEGPATIEWTLFGHAEQEALDV